MKSSKNDGLRHIGDSQVIADHPAGLGGAPDELQHESADGEGEQGGRGRVLEGVAAAPDPERPAANPRSHHGVFPRYPKNAAPGERRQAGGGS
jgi:hypothetical protein